MQLVNKCPFGLRIFNEAGITACHLAPSPSPTEVVTRKKIVGRTSEGVPMFIFEIEELRNVPERKEGVIYLVTRYVSAALPEREDFWVPGKTVRKKGKVGAIGIERRC